MKAIAFLLCFFCFNFQGYAQAHGGNDLIIANGYMPNIAKGKNNALHIVYGTGDSIMYVFSRDGTSFTSPVLVAVLPKLFASAMRGPQITAGINEVVVTACTGNGNIFSYRKEQSGKWSNAMRVNDISEVAKEALMALGSDGPVVYAVWLGVKGTKGQNVYGARSTDGGKTWPKNVLVYASPDSSVCECCKPSVAVKGSEVFVMFRNWLGGNRDVYLIKSRDDGQSFGQAQKLGKGSWKLDGCPMDGGGLVINDAGTPQTVWRRAGKIYTASLGLREVELGEGRGCSIETTGVKNMYAWTESGNVILMNDGKKTNLGKGSLPLVKALNNGTIICVFQDEKQIHAARL